jgi:hypothetical protein
MLSLEGGVFPGIVASMTGIEPGRDEAFSQYPLSGREIE